ncbi:hypothetical protein GY45DRAFT_1432553 [Cubamyces sp. BRFM 1775]|nr:hypothetical protein GY45DRAFT_1432553 [Cubamyces sp. BRFM 1775]
MSAIQVFRCEELATEIFKHFTPGPLRKTDTLQYRLRRHERQKALSRAARICRACTAPALDVLWRVVDDIYILLSLLPPTIRGRNAYVFTRDLTLSEWERFQQYATRVRELHWKPPSIGFEYDPDRGVAIDINISPSVWMILARWCHGKALCPRLGYLAPLHLSPNLPGPLILVSPTLWHLGISVHESILSEDDLALSSLFSSLGPVFASLESLIIDAGSYVGLVDNWLTSPDCETRFIDLTDARALQHLEIQTPLYTVSNSFVRSCEDIGLRSLSLVIAELDLDVSFDNEDPSPLRVTLRELHLSGDPHLLMPFIEHVVGPSLEVLDLQFTGIRHTPLNEFHTILGRVVAKISPNVTRFSLTLADSDIEMPWDMRQVPAIELLRPLLPKAHLTHVALILAYKRDHGLFTQQDMVAMADIWPNLVELRISNTQCQPPSNGHRSSPCVGDLIHFAERHPRLEHLVLPSLNADAKSLPALHEVPQLNHRLEFLRIQAITGFPYYRTTFALAQILDRVFPYLDLSRPQFEGPRGIGRTRVDVWDEVERALLALQTGRRGGCVT